jgi:hypothetical protein
MNSRISDWRGVIGGETEEEVTISRLPGKALLSMYTVLNGIARGCKVGEPAAVDGSAR